MDFWRRTSVGEKFLMGFLDEAIRDLKVKAIPTPDPSDLVSVFSDQDLLLCRSRFKAYIGKGLATKDVERAAVEDVLRDRPIDKANFVAAWYWATYVSPTGRGDYAWAWIQGHAQHGVAVHKAEAEIDRIGSKGNPEDLEAACNSLQEAWRKAIEGWLIESSRDSA
jgi:hypothetical protein